jgi:hypothetical protein
MTKHAQGLQVRWSVVRPFLVDVVNLQSGLATTRLAGREPMFARLGVEGFA